MNRTFLLVGLIALIALDACRGAVAANGAAPSPSMRDAGDSALVLSLERSIWEAERRRDRLGVDTLTAPDFVYLSSIARRDRSKQEDLDNRFGPHVTLEAYELRGLRAKQVSRDVMALHFLAEQRIRTDSVLICPRTGTSETWAKRAGRWLLITRTEYLLGVDRPPQCQDQSRP